MILNNCPDLETVYLGKSATNVSLNLTKCAKLTSLIFPDTAVNIAVTLTGTDVEIDDSELVICGESYENYGRHMELELIHEYDDT